MQYCIVQTQYVHGPFDFPFNPLFPRFMDLERPLESQNAALKTAQCDWKIFESVLFNTKL